MRHVFDGIIKAGSDYAEAGRIHFQQFLGPFLRFIIDFINRVNCIDQAHLEGILGIIPAAEGHQEYRLVPTTLAR